MDFYCKKLYFGRQPSARAEALGGKGIQFLLMEI